MGVVDGAGEGEVGFLQAVKEAGLRGNGLQDMVWEKEERGRGRRRGNWARKIYQRDGILIFMREGIWACWGWGFFRRKRKGWAAAMSLSDGCPTGGAIPRSRGAVHGPHVPKGGRFRP